MKKTTSKQHKGTCTLMQIILGVKTKINKQYRSPIGPQSNEIKGKAAN